MKENLTISVDRAAKRKAEAHKRRTGMTLGQIFELGVAFAVAAPDEKAHPFEKLVGTLEFTEQDGKANDRVGRVVRKMRGTQSRKPKAKRA